MTSVMTGRPLTIITATVAGRGGMAAALKAPPPGSCLFWHHQSPGAMSLNLLLFAGKG